MNVSLTSELERFVNAKVESGRYNSASEVIREALRLLEEHDQARALQLTEFNQ
jgi:antitoxin ParD1/3/4